MAQVDLHGGKALALISKLRRDAAMADSFAISGHPHVYTTLHLKAATYIWLCAILEEYLNNYCASLNKEITLLGLPCASMRFSIFCLSQEVGFSRLYQVAKIEKFDIRDSILMSISRLDPLVISDDAIPLDGKTIRPSHLEVIWKVYGLPGQPFYSLVDASYLNDLAEWRNKLAHGEETYTTFASHKTFQAVIRTIDAVRDVIETTLIAYEEYFRRRLYLR